MTIRRHCARAGRVKIVPFVLGVLCARESRLRRGESPAARGVSHCALPIGGPRWRQETQIPAWSALVLLYARDSTAMECAMISCAS